MIDTLKKVIEDIADLRDSDEHVCPHAHWQQWVDEGVKVDEEEAYPCTCEDYDAVIDEIQDIIDNIDSDSPTPEECIYLRNEIKRKADLLYCNDCKRLSIFEINEYQDPVYSNGKRLRECIKCGRYEERKEK